MSYSDGNCSPGKCPPDAGHAGHLAQAGATAWRKGRWRRDQKRRRLGWACSRGFLQGGARASCGPSPRPTPQVGTKGAYRKVHLSDRPAGDPTNPDRGRPPTGPPAPPQPQKSGHLASLHAQYVSLLWCLPSPGCTALLADTPPSICASVLCPGVLVVVAHHWTPLMGNVCAFSG